MGNPSTQTSSLSRIMPKWEQKSLCRYQTYEMLLEVGSECIATSKDNLRLKFESTAGYEYGTSFFYNVALQIVDFHIKHLDLSQLRAGDKISKENPILK